MSTHLPTLEGWTAELAVDIWLVVPTTGFEPMRVDLTRFEISHLNHSQKSQNKTIKKLRDEKFFLSFISFFIPMILLRFQR